MNIFEKCLAIIKTTAYNVLHGSNGAAKNRRIKMNAYELYDAYFDEGNTERQDTVDDLQNYASNAFEDGVYINQETAELIFNCRKKVFELSEQDGNWSNNLFFHAEEILQEIEL